jgi:hypothetical protein
MTKNLKEILEVADIHVNRIKLAETKIQALYPFDADKIRVLDDNALAWIEVLIHRFGKLQDLIGSKLIDVFLDLNQESMPTQTMLDKLNKLERLGIVKIDLWTQMRDARNHVAHEYPNDPALTAFYLNQLIDLIPKLLELYRMLSDKITIIID